MIEIVMEVDDEFWNILNQLKEFKGQKVLIHCEECKYFMHEKGCVLQGEDYTWEEQMYADDFCSRGEKRDE